MAIHRTNENQPRPSTGGRTPTTQQARPAASAPPAAPPAPTGPAPSAPTSPTASDRYARERAPSLPSEADAPQAPVPSSPGAPESFRVRPGTDPGAAARQSSTSSSGAAGGDRAQGASGGQPSGGAQGAGRPQDAQGAQEGAGGAAGTDNDKKAGKKKKAEEADEADEAEEVEEKGGTEGEKAADGAEVPEGMQVVSEQSSNTIEGEEGNRSGVASSDRVMQGENGAVRREHSREAVYERTSELAKEYEGDLGKVSGSVKTELATSASLKTNSQIDSNGVDMAMESKVGLSSMVTVETKAESKTVDVYGVPVGVKGEFKASSGGEVSAEVAGRATFTKDPPTAVVGGNVGFSAVVKTEGEVKASVGPFSAGVKGYASLGAEANIGGELGYEDGKLRMSFDMGAALGIGGGVKFDASVDVEQLKTMAKNAADVSGDGKVDVHDLAALGLQGTVAAVEAAQAGAAKVRAVVDDGVAAAQAKMNEVAGRVREQSDAAARAVAETVSAATDKVRQWWPFGGEASPAPAGGAQVSGSAQADLGLVGP